MNKTDLILKHAATVSAVAFDVFDTLILRDTARPTDVFAMMGEAFAACRLQAEREARAEKQGEVTLAEIYARPCLSGYDPKAELAAELAVCTPNLPLLHAAQKLHEQGKRIYYISDMYLPKTQIDAMLRKCGYTFLDGGFVSSEYGVQKRSGKLFRVFLQKTGLAAKKVLFVGDDRRADYLGAALGGIRAVLLPPPSPMNHPAQGQGLAPGAVRAFTQNRLPAQQTQAEAVGFACLGPLAVAFCRWLHRQRRNHPQAKLFFLARDMYMMRRVYSLLYPQETTYYLQVSRRSLCPAFLAAGKMEQLLAALPRQQLTGREIAAYCGAMCPAATADTIYDLKHAPQTVRPLLAQLTPMGDTDLVQRYLAAQNIAAGDILADIGSGGTTQLLLQNLCGVPLYGCLLACDERLHRNLPPDTAAAFLFDGNPAPLNYWAIQPVLERLISQDVGATLGYTLRGGAITVRHAAQTGEPILEDLQAGILQFAKCWQTSFLNGLEIPPQTAAAPMLSLLGNPAAEEVRLLGGLTVEDGSVYPLAVPQSMGYYLLHPAQARHDFSAARWKVGFLKGLLPLPLPYERIYCAWKRKQ